MFPLVEFISNAISGSGRVAKSKECIGSVGLSFFGSRAFAIRPVVRAVMPTDASLGIIARIFPCALDSFTENLLLSHQSQVTSRRPFSILRFKSPKQL